MGFNHVDAAIKARLPHQTGIEMSTLKLVLIVLCQHASNEDNTCFPSTRRLARMALCHQSTVSRAIGYLNGMGCFDVYAKGNGRGASFYRIDLERLKGWAIDFSVRETDSSDAEGIANDENSDAGSIKKNPEDSRCDAESIEAMLGASPRCGDGPQRCGGEPNQSFDRLGNQSEKSVRGLAALASPQSQNNKTESVTPDCSLVARTTAKPTPDPDPCPKCLGEEFDGVMQHHDTCPLRIKVLSVFA